jgi:methionyl-tRNA formyltransferase
VAYFNYNGEKIKVYSSKISSATGTAGVVLDDKLTIACSDGSIRLLELQRPGRKIMPAEELLRGYPLLTGTKLDA